MFKVEINAVHSTHGQHVRDMTNRSKGTKLKNETKSTAYFCVLMSATLERGNRQCETYSMYMYEYERWFMFLNKNKNNFIFCINQPGWEFWLD